MILEWMRRKDSTFSKELKGYFLLINPLHTNRYLYCIQVIR